MTVTYTDALVFRIFQQWAFEGIQPSEPDAVIADYLISKCQELQFHRYDEILKAVALWKDREFVGGVK